jgi:DNA-binding MarR family transcriptional regulator
MIDLKDNLGRHIALSGRHLAKIVAKRLEPFGIGAGQYPYIFALFNRDGQTQQSLAKNLVLDKAAVTRALDKLAKSGYVKRKADEKDSRSIRIFLTPKARKIRGKLENAVGVVLDEIQNGLTAEERDTVNNIMRKITENLLQKND